MEYVENRPTTCNVCGAVSVGRISESLDKQGNKTVLCTWCCSRCGSKFKEGVVEYVPANDDSADKQK